MELNLNQFRVLRVANSACSEKNILYRSKMRLFFASSGTNVSWDQCLEERQTRTIRREVQQIQKILERKLLSNVRQETP